MIPAAAKLALLSLFSIASRGIGYTQNDNSYLEKKRERDEPIPLYKSVSEILTENWWILAHNANDVPNLSCSFNCCVILFF